MSEYKPKKPKSSFVLYYDLEEQTKTLTDAQLGQLLRAIFRYEKNGEVPTPCADPLISLCFGFVKSGLDANKQKYLKRCERNANNRAKGNANGDHSSPTVTTGTDTDYDTDNDTDTDNETDSEHNEHNVSLPEWGGDSHKFFKVYNDMYCREYGIQHPRVKVSQLQRCIDELNDKEINNLTTDEMQDLIQAFFDHCEHTDGNINHFCTDGILTNALYNAGIE